MIQVKVFDYEHEKDLEDEMNGFLQNIKESQIIDIKYNVAATGEGEEEEEQIYCFSAMVIYKKSKV
ncbi:sporulation protein Cse60 [Bacillus massiliglaciei]|uniref:sporulation protein Cse60 n=1 Tax=Bacillus massiliglaciei TaxID=1816693 RepID=UPI000A71F3EC|nr:sporulation protein Cse60 [Bacillus massiliglaciei]